MESEKRSTIPVITIPTWEESRERSVANLLESLRVHELGPDMGGGLKVDCLLLAAVRVCREYRIDVRSLWEVIVEHYNHERRNKL